MNPNLTPAAGTRRKHRKTSDWSTYRRLVGYLRGTGAVMAVLFSCMVLEAAFTAASIGMVKPLVDIVAGNPIISPPDENHEPAPNEASATPAFIENLKQLKKLIDGQTRLV